MSTPSGNPNIVIFSWNATGLRICETISQARADASRGKILSFFGIKKPCIAPDFFEVLRTEINVKKPIFAVFVTEDEDATKTYFHAELLPHAMGDIGYALLKRHVLENVGGVPSGAVYEDAITGRPSGSALRLSIYVPQTSFDAMKESQNLLSRAIPNDGEFSPVRKSGTRVMGGLVSHVWHPNYGRFAFVSCSFPEGIEAHNVGRSLTYEAYRETIKASNKLAMIAILEEGIGNLPPNVRPEYTFIVGDLCYDIIDPNNRPMANQIKDTPATLRKLDELSVIIEKKEIPFGDFNEGVNGQGPQFAPTFRLKRGRGDDCNNDEQIPREGCLAKSGYEYTPFGWHDRILHTNFTDMPNQIRCVSYKRLDVGNIHQSTHAGVYGNFEMVGRSGSGQGQVVPGFGVGGVGVVGGGGVGVVGGGNVAVAGPGGAVVSPGSVVISPGIGGGVGGGGAGGGAGGFNLRPTNQQILQGYNQGVQQVQNLPLPPPPARPAPQPPLFQQQVLQNPQVPLYQQPLQQVGGYQPQFNPPFGQNIQNIPR